MCLLGNVLHLGISVYIDVAFIQMISFHNCYFIINVQLPANPVNLILLFRVSTLIIDNCDHNLHRCILSCLCHVNVNYLKKVFSVQPQYRLLSDTAPYNWKDTFK